jgi:arsenate reductase (thioredoxin)
VERRPAILFLCTGNSFRSQMAEAILKDKGGDKFSVCSAGSCPAGFIHPLAEFALAHWGIPLKNQSSKSWNEYADGSFDAVITLCDEAAGESCPVWSGAPIRVHWSLPDPARQEVSEDERRAAAIRVAERLIEKIRGLMAVDWSGPREQIEQRLAALGGI